MRRYRVLSPSDVAAVLPALDGWTGDTSCLTRTVATDDADGLLGRVAAVQAELDHHAVVERETGLLTFRLWTHAKGGVTDADVELAQVLDGVIAAH